MEDIVWEIMTAEDNMHGYIDEEEWVTAVRTNHPWVRLTILLSSPVFSLFSSLLPPPSSSSLFFVLLYLFIDFFFQALKT